MALPLEEDFSDVAEFVQEDNEPAASEDEVERKIAEEHAKYKEALAKRQEEVRASRPWSAPPVDSPRPEQQKEREKERQARGSNSDAAAVDAPRAEYEPPVRPYLLQAQTSGSNLSYLSRPQSAEHRTAARLLNGHGSRASLSGIEEEAGEGTGPNSRHPSDLGRLGSTLGELPAPGQEEAPGQDNRGLTREDEEGVPGQGDGGAAETEEEAVPLEEEQGAGEDGDEGGQGGGGHEEEGEEGEGRERRDEGEPSAQEVAEDSRGGAGEEDEQEEEDEEGGEGRRLSGDHHGDGTAFQQRPQQEPQPRASWQRSSSGGGAGRGGERPVAEQEEEEVPVNAAWWRSEDASSAKRGSYHSGGGSRYGAASGAPSVTASTAMAMRGFVEPLPYESSYGARTPTVVAAAEGREGSDQEDERAAGYQGSDVDGGEEEEEDDYEDSFEDYEEMEEEDSGNTAHAAGRGPSQASAEPSSSRGPLSRTASRRLGGGSRSSSVRGLPSREHSRALLPPPPSYPNTPGVAGVGNDDDEEAWLPMVESLLPPLLPVKTDSGVGPEAAVSPATMQSNRRSLGGAVSSSPAAPRPAASSLPPPQQPELDLLPPQQFALQLLRHDIDVLPQHHRAAAEAAAAARRKSAATRPAGSGLAAFGYLGYHIVPEDLTAPGGPVFRSVSPGRSSSPGRGDGSSGLMASTSMKAVRPASQEAAPGGRGGRPTSAPHMRPNSANAAQAEGGRGSARVSFGAEDGAEGQEAVALPAAVFIGTTREMRAARLLPPVGPPRARSSSGGSGLLPAAAATGDGAAVPSEKALSVLDDHGVSTAHNRMKFDVWLDSLNGKAAAAAGGPKHGASGSGAGDVAPASESVPLSRRPPRPMTAPATGRRRPLSARPVAGAGLFGMPPPVANVPKPLARPLSAQPHYLRPSSATNGPGNAGGGRGGLAGADAPADPSGAMPAATVVEGSTAAGGTAAVEIAGVTVSVYVADTLKRIVEANRWLQTMGVTTKRYRLKDRLSNMLVQLCEEVPSDRGGYDPYDDGGGAMTVVKELTLKQFLSGHAKLKQQAKKLRQRQQLAAALPPQGAGAGPTFIGTAGGAYGGQMDFGSGASAARVHRPFSAALGGGGAGASRGRPVSAAPYSGVRPSATSAGGADPALYGGAAAGTGSGMHPGGYAGGRPVRPSSANPAYGRTPSFGTYGTGSSPPGVPSGAFAAYGSSGGAGARPSSASPGALQAPRAAWGSATVGAGASSGGYPQHQNYSVTSTGGCLPYMYRSVSATARAQTAIQGDDYDDDGEPTLVVEPDEHGDISRAVRQQLGGATDYCQARRHEIARLRNMPLA